MLKDPHYRYFANESYLNAGPVRVGVRNYLRDGSLPPKFDPKPTSVDLMAIARIIFDPKEMDRDLLEIARRMLPRRYQPVLDLSCANPRYVLPIGTSILDGAARDARMAQHLFEEIADRRMSAVTPGIVLLGAVHASAVPTAGWPTTRMLIEKRGYKCVSIRVLTDFESDGNVDDAVVPLGTDLTKVSSGDIIRLTSLVAKTPVTIPTSADGQTAHSVRSTSAQTTIRWLMSSSISCCKSTRLGSRRSFHNTVAGFKGKVRTTRFEKTLPDHPPPPGNPGLLANSRVRCRFRNPIGRRRTRRCTSHNLKSDNLW